MSIYAGTVTQSTDRRNAPVTGGRLGKLGIGTQVTGDAAFLGWLRLTSHKGWYPLSHLAYSEVQPPPPVQPETPVIEITRVEGTIDNEPFTWTPQSSVVDAGQ